MSDPARLSEPEHWQTVHRREAPVTGTRAHLRRLLGRSLFELFYYGGYTGHVVHERALGPALQRGARILEVGSAPGRTLAKLAARFDLEPWGLEYTANGAETNRVVFKNFGFPCEHVIEADFFSDALLAQHRERFDVVVSNGFIEHFSDPAPVVARHLELVRRGGILAISIPNLAGVNLWLGRLFNARVVAKHNLDIMSLAAFRRLFDTLELEPLFCDFVGVFDFGLLNAPEHSLRDRVLGLLRLAQKPLDVATRLLWGAGAPTHRWLSPMLQYVGRRP